MQPFDLISSRSLSRNQCGNDPGGMLSAIDLVVPVVATKDDDFRVPGDEESNSLLLLFLPDMEFCESKVPALL